MKSPDLSLLYRNAIRDSSRLSNDAQGHVVERLQPVMDRLVHKEHSSDFWSGLFRKSSAIRGAYIYGEVGAGKTMIMDLFYDSYPGNDKKRIHFNQFMFDVHSRIHALRKSGTAGNRLVFEVAAELGRHNKLLCLDEFQVVDIADAMILRGLIDSLLRQNTTLMMTSNRKPAELYLNGIQRASFMPCIRLIEDRLDVLSLNSEVDYRLQSVDKQGDNHLFYPITEKSTERLKELFTECTQGKPTHERRVTAMGREIRVKRALDRTAWFEFDELFKVPYYSTEYLALARKFDIFFLAGVPKFSSADMRPEARRFVTFIDIIYDLKARVALQLDCPVEGIFPLKGEKEHDRELLDDLGASAAASLFSGAEERFAGNRAISRIYQMTSRAWWNKK